MLISARSLQRFSTSSLLLLSWPGVLIKHSSRRKTFHADLKRYSSLITLILPSKLLERIEECTEKTPAQEEVNLLWHKHVWTKSFPWQWHILWSFIWLQKSSWIWRTIPSWKIPMQKRTFTHSMNCNYNFPIVKFFLNIIWCFEDVRENLIRYDCRTQVWACALKSECFSDTTCMMYNFVDESYVSRQSMKIWWNMIVAKR